MNFGILGNLIFTNWKVEDFDYSTFDNIRNGLDFGFGVDPLAFVRLHIDKKHKKLYIYDEIYATELSNEEAAEIIKCKLDKQTELITCDSSEPKSIRQLRDLKLNAVGAKKGAGSIETGIKFLKSFEIVIHLKCVNTKMEFSKYKWKEDKNGVVLPIPVDKDNHCLVGDTYVWTESGKVKIKDLNEKTNVYSYNENTKTIELKKCFDVRKTRDNANVYELTLKNGKKVRCTDNHSILTKEGWKELKNITEKDFVLDVNATF